MYIDDITRLYDEYVMNSYGRNKIAFERGVGSLLYTTEGERYIDLLSGIGVVALGHNNGTINSVIMQNIVKLMHTSNLYYNENQALCAEKLCKATGFKKVFFANSGTEANEGAYKIARLYQSKKGKTKAVNILSLKGSFHGRTLASLAATGQEKFHAKYQPLPQGFLNIECTIDALDKALNDETAGIIIEVVQGESGVNPLERELVQFIDKACKERDIVFMVDEVQSGVGRTGKFLAFEHYGVNPDVATIAKGIGNGFPLGAVLARNGKESLFEPGDHASTFGGNHLGCAIGLKVVETISDEKFLQSVTAKSELAKKVFYDNIDPKHKDKVKFRGIGLMLGIYLDSSDMALRSKVSGAVVDYAFKHFVLVNNASGNTVRLLPPLNTEDSILSEGLEVIAHGFNKVLTENNI